MVFKSSLNLLAKATSVVTLTFGLVLVGQPDQQASAQITGAGTSSITTLIDALPFRYVITGSGTGRDRFLLPETDRNRTGFVASDVSPITVRVGGVTRLETNDEAIARTFGFKTTVNPPSSQLPLPSSATDITNFKKLYLAVNEATLNIALPYNVPGFNGRLTPAQACRIINGNLTNWSQIPGSGSTLPIIRVVRGDNSGISAVLQNTFLGPICGSSIFNPSNGALNTLPLPKTNDIIVAAPNDPALPSPVDPFNTGDDKNATGVSTDPEFGRTRNYGSYSLGVTNAVALTPGAIGYTETATALAQDLPLAVNVNTPGRSTTTIAVAPTYFVFRQFYPDQAQADAALAVCSAVTSSDNLDAANFDIFTTGAEKGTDTDDPNGLCGTIQGPDDLSPVEQLPG